MRDRELPSMLKTIRLLEGAHLTAFAKSYGFKRRWFGLEPDILLRGRMVEYLFVMYLRR